MYGIVRIIFFGVIFLICMLFMKKYEILKGKNIIVTIIFMIIFCTISVLFPVENHFITFSTPEKAYGYMNFEEVKLVIEGKKSAFVLGEKDRADYVYLVIPKSETGWKLGRGIDTKLKEQKIEEGIVVSIYQYKNSDDYYVTIVDMGDRKNEISDSCNSKFITLNYTNKELGSSYSSYYASVLKYSKNYWVSVNGKQICFSE